MEVDYLEQLATKMQQWIWLNKQFQLLLAIGVNGSAHVEHMLQRDLVIIADNLIQGSVVQGCGHATKQAGNTLTGVQDVSIRSKHNDESVSRPNIR